MTLDATQEREIAELTKLAGIAVSWLVIMLVASLGLGIAVLSDALAKDAAWRLVLLCVLGGTLGSSISALLSAAERISYGWEFSWGDKYPPPDPTNPKSKDKFVARMFPFFVIRPFLGSAMGLVVYVGLKSGYLIAVQNPEEATFSREGLLFLAFLGGLFAKTLIEKLRAMFDTLFGK